MKKGFIFGVMIVFIFFFNYSVFAETSFKKECFIAVINFQEIMQKVMSNICPECKNGFVSNNFYTGLRITDNSDFKNKDGILPSDKAADINKIRGKVHTLVVDYVIKNKGCSIVVDQAQILGCRKDMFVLTEEVIEFLKPKFIELKLMLELDNKN